MSVLIKDSHKKDGSIQIVGLWVFTSPTGRVMLGADLGECQHCVNHVEVDDNGDVVLSRVSFGGTYSPLNGSQSWLIDREGFTVERISFTNVLDVRDAIYNASAKNVALKKAQLSA